MAAAMGRQLWEQVRPRVGYQRYLYWAGAVLLASGLLHVGMVIAEPGPWLGPVSWRKPIVFGLSFGITAWGVGWVLGHLRPNRWLGWLVGGTLGVASVVEVALITLQRWRGVPSHFNDATPFDVAVFGGMGISVMLVAVAIVIALVWAVLDLRRDPVVWWAAVAGLAMISAASYIGVDMIERGDVVVEATGQVPFSVVFGAAGSAKLAHAVGMHGLQILGGLAVALRLGAAPGGRQVWTMRIASGSYSLLFAVVSLQAYAGRAVMDMPVTVAGAAVAAAVAVGWAAVSAMRSWWRATARQTDVTA